ncbi:MAG: enoyl-CoA hydratase-related protein [Salinisphaera sp.]|nr:enoyl-CoA hydratase-related protein [Salinisphaera sp.]
MDYETITYEIDDAVAVITLNRPDQLNALNGKLLAELLAALRAAQADDGVRALLLRAAGRAFCSGADLKEGLAADLGEHLRQHYHPIIKTMRSMEKPIVAAVQGLAAGAGASIALAADMVVAGESGGFQQIFTNIGLIPDAGSTHAMPHRIGHARAMGAVLTGEAIGAARAERWGLIWQAVADDELDATARALAASLAARPTRALGLAKQLLEAAADNNLAAQLEAEAQGQSQMQHTADFAEAIQAFLAKRPARFTGR